MKSVLPDQIIYHASPLPPALSFSSGHAICDGGHSRRILRDLYRQFKDWPLAVAAYNAGAGRVKSKLSEKKLKTFEDISTRLPSETQMYVPKLNSILQLREGTTLEKLGQPR